MSWKSRGEGGGGGGMMHRFGRNVTTMSTILCFQASREDLMVPYNLLK